METSTGGAFFRTLAHDDGVFKFSHTFSEDEEAVAGMVFRWDGIETSTSEDMFLLVYRDNLLFRLQIGTVERESSG